MSSRRLSVLGLVIAAFTFTAKADVKLNGLFTDGAVLQQGRELPVWGTADNGEKVTVKLLDQEVSTVAKEGRWMVRLKAIKAGGPHTMTVTGKNTVTIRNLLIGEVWLCSGQSNMAFQLYRASNGAEAIASANDPQLRFFQVPHRAADEPETDVLGKWQETTPAAISNFSAVAYFFGRDLRKALNVPIGLIDSSVGGTPAEAWIPMKTLEPNPDLKAILERQAESVRKYQAGKAATGPADATTAAQKATKKGKSKGATTAKKAAAPADPSKTSKRPSGLYNAMIAPLEPFALAGVIWYQGEANSGRAAEYVPLFSAMIGSWREAWGQGDFPFLFVQIAPHQRMSPDIREAQLLVSEKVPRTAMAVITDFGNETDIHPKDKEPVGHRLALAARAIAYGEKIEYSGPVCESAKPQDGKLNLSFGHVDGGLMAKDGELRGFEIAGTDGNFVPAKAVIEGNEVVVLNREVSNPVMVRYGWTNTPSINLFNKAGLPATPFRVTAK